MNRKLRFAAVSAFVAVLSAAMFVRSAAVQPAEKATAPVIDPPPLRIEKVTEIPSTPMPAASLTFTAGAIATAVFGCAT